MREATGVVCLKFNVRNFGNVVDAFMHKIKKEANFQKMSTQMRRRKIGSALFTILSTFLATLGNT